jgi:hypothetical protein
MAAALAVVCLLRPGQASAQTPARLTVEVRNNTANGAPVAGDEITLDLHRGPQQIDSRSARVGEDGRVVFENLPTGQGIAAVARVKHQNMAFRSRPVALDSAAAELSASGQVFDVSTDASKLSIGVHHLMVAFRGTSLEFTEFMQLSNSSDMAVTGRERDDRNRPVVLRIMLPAGFRDLTASSYLEREALVVTGEGFYDTMAVPPGEHQITFSYKIDVGRGATQIAKEITLPTSHLMIFWEHGEGALKGLGEPSGRLVNADGTPIEYYRRTGLKPGEKLAFQIAGLSRRGSNASTWIILAVVFAAILIVALLRSGPKSTKSG